MSTWCSPDLKTPFKFQHTRKDRSLVTEREGHSQQKRKVRRPAIFSVGVRPMGAATATATATAHRASSSDHPSGRHSSNPPLGMSFPFHLETEDNEAFRATNCRSIAVTQSSAKTVHATTSLPTMMAHRKDRGKGRQMLTA